MPEQALPLLELPIVLTRGEFLALANAGALSIDAVRALSQAELEGLLGTQRARVLSRAMDQ
jgi:helicase